jgi:signal transduction histidine kinase
MAWLSLGGRWSFDRYSLRWRLPLLISALISFVLSMFLVVTYREVTSLQIHAAGTRAQLAADQLASLLAQSNPQRLREAQELAAVPDLSSCLERRSADACRTFEATVQALPGTAPRLVELWTNDQQRLVSIAVPPTSEPTPSTESPSRATVGVGRLHKHPNGLYSETVIEVPVAPALTPQEPPPAPAGFIVVRRQIVASATRDVLNQLVGRGASITVGNRIGDVWTDLAIQVPAPAIDLTRPGVARYHGPDGRAYVGALTHIPDTPTATWVEFPEDVVLAESRALLQRMLLIGALFLVAASASAWVLSGRITTPLGKLTAQAEAIAAGDYTPTVTSDRRDEIGRLTIASNKMASRIRDAHHELEARVMKRTAELAAVNEELESFSYSVSHDLRAPLRHIGGFANLLETAAGPRLQDTDRRYLKIIVDAATRMGQLIDDLLAFSRSGRSPMVTKTVDLQALVDDVQRELSSSVNGRTIRWTVHALPSVNADPAMLRQVAANLLSNAVKYTSTRAEAHIEIGTTERHTGELTVFVRDNGVGFDMQYAHKLFGVFQRLHRLDEFEGTGIGLANVQRIVQRHGGRVWAEAEVDAGATFYFSLPLGLEQHA